MKRKLVTTLTLLASAQASAYTVNVNSSVPISTQVMPALSSIEATLGEILTTEIQVGSAITQASDKNVAILSEGFRAQRDADNFGRQTERLEAARSSFTVPDSICSESASGAAHQVSNTAKATESTFTGGGKITNEAIRKAVTSPPLNQDQNEYRSAAIHANYCTAEEYKLYGGTGLCPAVSPMPGGDIDISSVLYGAGETGKNPDLTFSHDQINAAMAYLHNSAKRSAGRTPGKGDIKTTTGWRYQGLLSQYKSVQSAGIQPQLAMIASSTPNEGTKTALQEALQSPAAKAWFDANASEQAKKTNILSEREFEAFEVGRRYANVDYETDLQAMEGDNLIRELIRVQSLSNWLQSGIKYEIQKGNIIAGQALTVLADSAWEPKLQALSAQMSAGVSK